MKNTKGKPESLQKSSIIRGEDFLFIPGNVPSKKNSRWIRNNKLVPSKQMQDYLHESKEYWKQGKLIFDEIVKKAKKPYHIEFSFIRKTKARYDWINPLQTVQDLMVEYKWIEDDSTEYIKPFFGMTHCDKESPGVVIRIMNINKANNA